MLDKTAERRRKHNLRIDDLFRTALLQIQNARTEAEKEKATAYYNGLRDGVLLSKPNSGWQKRINRIRKEIKEETDHE